MAASYGLPIFQLTPDEIKQLGLREQKEMLLLSLLVAGFHGNASAATAWLNHQAIHADQEEIPDWQKQQLIELLTEELAAKKAAANDHQTDA